MRRKKFWTVLLMFSLVFSTIVSATPVKAEEGQTLLTSSMDPKIVNVAFVIDSTGSMYDDIGNVKKNLEKFVDYLGKKDIIVRMSLIDYQDITYDGMDSTTVHQLNHSVWFESTEDMNRELSAIALGNGGDTPETLIDAMGYLLDEDLMTFNSSAVKFAFVLTDANYKVNNRHGIKDMPELISRLQDMGIYTSIVTNKVFMEEYKNLAYYDPELVNAGISDTGYTLWNINDDFGKIIIDFAEYILNTPAPEPSPNVPVTGITFPSDKENIKLNVGETVTITPQLVPTDATNQTINWYSEQEKIAKVENGVITALEPGVTKITAVTDDGGYTAVSVVTVGEKEEFDEDDAFNDLTEGSSLPSFNILQLLKEAVQVEKGRSYQLFYDVYPDQTVTFESENPKIATVDENGKVTGVAKGMTTIVATTEDGFTTAECLVTVLVKPTKIKLNQKKVILHEGDKLKLKASLSPTNINKKYKTVLWSTNNKNVATVSKNGVVYAKKEGTCVITANTLNGFRVSCTIVVQPAQEQ